MERNVVIVDLDELKAKLISSLNERAIRVSTLKAPHTFLKAVGTHEIERVVNSLFDELKN